MKRMILCVMVLLLLLMPVFSATGEEYREDEFPEWALSLRRGETLFFGSLPLTCALTSVTYTLAQNAGMSPLHSTDLGEAVIVVGSAAVLSLAVAVVDYLLGE